MGATGIEADVRKIKADFGRLKWMVGFNLALTVAIALKVFAH